MDVSTLPKKKIHEKLKEYYRTEFSLNDALKIITKEQFANREWGFLDINGHFDRNFSFASPDKLIDYIKESVPRSIYVGAIYSEGPDNFQKRSIHDVEWIRKELVFDLDLNEYDDVRPCSCRGKYQICDKCWELVKTAANWINETMIEDFGVSKDNINWVFSGRRGVHAWITEFEMMELDNEQRTAIIDYLTLFKGRGKEVRLLEDPYDYPINLRARINTEIYIPFLRECTIQQLLSLGLSKERALFILEQRDKQGIDQLFLSKYIFLDKVSLERLHITDFPSRRAIEEGIIIQWGPRIDAAVSKDMRRILRLPGSIHGDTGKRVRLLEEDELEYFSPLDEISIFDE
ncbi:MAG: DNA primase catalytic subunit PriS [Candidatus Thorarchaeota archaeon]